jgi:uncharacterized protein
MSSVEHLPKFGPYPAGKQGAFTQLMRGLSADFSRYSAPVACLRALRASRLMTMGDIGARLQQNMAFRQHVQLMGVRDEFFFLSHRHFLAKGLTAKQRAETALFHYEYEAKSNTKVYFDKVYRQGGLTLWRSINDNVSYEIRLMAGNDVLHEGGLSIVFFVNDERVCVVSYSIVPKTVFLPNFEPRVGELPLGDALIYVTRKHMSTNSGYQKAFNKAFDRTTPAHLCFGALAGIAQTKGLNYFVGVEPDVHPSCQPAYEKTFKVAYSEFWDSLHGRRVSPFGSLVDLPLKFTPLEELEQKARKRAVARRAHIESAQLSAAAAMAR